MTENTIDTPKSTTVPATRFTVTTADGLDLAAYRYGESDDSTELPTVLLVHGYPDNHHVWDGVAAQLSGRAHVFAFDVRGAGESETPDSREGYSLGALTSDILRVIEAVGVDGVHLVGHDWGSIQAWHAVTDPVVAAKIVSLTSISGPHLDHAGRFFRSGAVVPRLRQGLSSMYIPYFLTPGAAEFAINAGGFGKLMGTLQKVGASSTLSATVEPYRGRKDFYNGLNLYRANMFRHITRPAADTRTAVPVQIITPSSDFFVGSAMQLAGLKSSPRTRQIAIKGGHWVPAQRPDVIANAITEWIDIVQNPAADSAVAVATPTSVPRKNRHVAGKVALVTGAGSGIGQACAVELARRGARAVIIVDLSLDRLADTEQQVTDAGCEAIARAVDVTDSEQLAALAAELEGRFGAVDIAVNNAGIGMAGRLFETSDDHWKKIMDVNLKAVIAGTTIFAEQMARRGRGGVILNMASASAFLPSKVMVAYSTTKSAVLGFTESVRPDLADEGIQVSAICPGFVNTNITTNTIYAGADEATQQRSRENASKAYARRNYTPETAAKKIISSIGRNKPVVLLGAETRVGYAASHYLPAAVRTFAKFDIRV